MTVENFNQEQTEFILQAAKSVLAAKFGFSVGALILSLFGFKEMNGLIKNARDINCFKRETFYNIMAFVMFSFIMWNAKNIIDLTFSHNAEILKEVKIITGVTK